MIKRENQNFDGWPLCNILIGKTFESCVAISSMLKCDSFDESNQRWYKLDNNISRT